MRTTIALALLSGTLACAALGAPPREDPAPAADPSVEAMVEALRAKPRTRSLAGARPGAATARAEGKLQLSVQFDFDSATLKPESRPLLEKLAAAMRTPELGRLEFRVEGHTDSTGGGAYNLRLSQRRALAVRDFLVGQGVDAGRLAALGMGSARPLDPANPAAAANRRVLVVSQEALPGAPIAAAPAAAPNARPHAAGAGTVEQVRGEVQVRRGPSNVVVVQGVRVREGDVLSSSRGAGAIVRLDDGAKLLLRAESVLRIARLKLSGDTSTWGQSFELVVGAFRYVTGALGGNRPEAVAFTTAQASVGIRGTDLDLVHAERDADGAEAGTYVKVNEGTVSLGGADGTRLVLSRNEQAFAGARKPRTRGGVPVPATVRLSEPAPVFRKADDLDDLIATR